MAWATAWEWMPVRPIQSNHLRKLVGPPTGATAGAGGIGLTMGRGGGGAAADMGTLPREGRLTRVFHTMTASARARPGPPGPGGPARRGQPRARRPDEHLDHARRHRLRRAGRQGLAPFAPLTGASLGQQAPTGSFVAASPGRLEAARRQACGGRHVRRQLRRMRRSGPDRPVRSHPQEVDPAGGRGCLDWGPLWCLEGPDEEPAAPPRACAAPFAACAPPFWADGRPRFRAPAVSPSAPLHQKSTDESGRTSWKRRTSSSASPTLFSAKCCSSRNSRADMPIVESLSWSTSACLRSLRSSKQSAAIVSSVHASELSELFEDEDLKTSALLSPSGDSSTSWSSTGSSPPSIASTQGPIFCNGRSVAGDLRFAFSDQRWQFLSEQYIYRSRHGISRCDFVIAACRAIFNWARTRLFWGIMGAKGA